MPKDDEDDTGTSEATVSKASFDALRAKHRATLEQVNELQQQVKTLEPKAVSAETLTGQIAALQTELGTERAGRQADRSVFQKGITDPEGIDLVHMQYGRLPAKDRPDFGKWLDTQTTEGSTAKWLTPYLPAKTDAKDGKTDGAGGAGAGSGAAGGGTGGTGAARPNPNGGVGGAGGGTGAGGAPTAAEVQAAQVQARSGNRAAWDAILVRQGQTPLPKLGE